jgi:hypothetical protein
MFCIGQIRFDFDDLGIDDLGRNLETFSKLRHMEDVMDGIEEEVGDGKLWVHRFQGFQRVRCIEEQVFLLRRTFEYLE